MRTTCSLFLLMLFIAPLQSQPIENRVAFVVGNANYAISPLNNPLNDARDVAAALREAGFDVTEKYNLTEDSLNILITDFSYKFRNTNTVAVFYYSGHGVQYNGNNYLIPIGSENLSIATDVEWRCIPLERITSKMQDAGNRLNIVILDACRAFPVPDISHDLKFGLAKYTRRLPESLIVYATGANKLAEEQPGSHNSRFTEKLLKYLRTPGLEIQFMFSKVQKEVEESSNGRQIPELIGNPSTKFFFFEEIKPVVKDTVPKPPDRDNDGVIDTLDQCPDVFGLLTNKGCPAQEKQKQKKPSGWDHCVGVSYSRFSTQGKPELNNPALESASYNGYRAYYLLVNKIGGYISIGTYSGTEALTNSGHSIPTAVMGSIGPAARILNTNAGFKVYLFAGFMVFEHKKEIFVDPPAYIGYELFLACSIKNLGLKAGFMTAFKNVKGFTVGLHYCL